MLQIVLLLVATVLALFLRERFPAYKWIVATVAGLSITAMKPVRLLFVTALSLFVCLDNAHALTAFFIREFTKEGVTYCEYDNGTILNPGVSICPLSIDESKETRILSRGLLTFLVSETTDSKGNRLFVYDNDSRINPGITLCPLSRRY